MTKIGILAMACALQTAFATTAFAKTSPPKVVVAHGVRQVVPLRGSCTSGFVCKQDLFDRLDKNNIRSDWPAPPAQPGQF
jgi:hypothetical protein